MTAEAALVIPLLVALTIVLSWFVTLGVAQVRAVDAARETARALARDDDRAEALALGRRVAPPDASFSVWSGGGTVSVEVTARVAGPGLLARLPPATVRGLAVAAEEER